MSQDPADQPLRVEKIVFNPPPTNTKEELYSKLLAPLTTATSLRDLFIKEQEAMRRVGQYEIVKDMSFRNHPSSDSSDGAVGVTVEVHLEENRKLQLKGKTNVTPTEGTATGSVEASLCSAFGQAEKFKLRIESDVDGSITSGGGDITASFTKPIINLHGDQEVSAFLSKYKAERSVYNNYSEDNLAAGLSYATGNHKFHYQCRLREITPHKTATAKIFQEGGVNLKSSFSHSYVYDTTDSILLPSQGFRFTADSELAGLGGDAKFVKQNFSVQKAIPLSLPLGLVLILGLRGGYHIPFGGSRSHISDRYFSGGIESFRGFEIRGVGPRFVPVHMRQQPETGDGLGADYYWGTSASLGLGLGEFSFGSLKGNLFLAGGNMTQWSPGEVISASIRRLAEPDKARVVAGVGLMLATSFGVRAEMNFNHHIQKQPSDVPVTFQIGLSGEFW